MNKSADEIGILIEEEHKGMEQSPKELYKQHHCIYTARKIRNSHADPRAPNNGYYYEPK
jgi:hypothetical protein